MSEFDEILSEANLRSIKRRVLALQVGVLSMTLIGALYLRPEEGANPMIAVPLAALFLMIPVPLAFAAAWRAGSCLWAASRQDLHEIAEAMRTIPELRDAVKAYGAERITSWQAYQLLGAVDWYRTAAKIKAAGIQTA